MLLLVKFETLKLYPKFKMPLLGLNSKTIKEILTNQNTYFALHPLQNTICVPNCQSNKDQTATNDFLARY